MAMAERELAAFFNAVTELFGSEQALLSAEDGLQEAMAIDMKNLRNNDRENNDRQNNDLQQNDLQASTRQWRLLTVKASARLARRVDASFDAFSKKRPNTAYSG
jgi:hypothetical protein